LRHELREERHSNVRQIIVHNAELHLTSTGTCLGTNASGVLGKINHRCLMARRRRARSRIVNATPIPDRTLNSFRFSTGIVIK